MKFRVPIPRSKKPPEGHTFTVVALKHSKGTRIEYEGDLTDEQAGRILQVILPDFDPATWRPKA